MKFHKIHLFLFAVILIAGCKKEKTPAQTTQPDIFVAGNSFIGNQSVATYWKNGTPTLLDDSTIPSNAYALAVNDGIVYAAGTSAGTQPDVQVATQWINGIKLQLTNGSVPSVASAIALSGSDVYVVGRYSTHNGVTVAAYWKNGVQYRLATDTTINSQAFGIAVSGGHIYIAGISAPSPGAEPEATVWNNGVITFIGHGSGSFLCTSAYGIAVNGNDVYLAGDYNFNSAPVYWKNGNINQVTGDPSTTVNAIAISGQDIYLSGYRLQAQTSNTYKIVPIVWKNGAPTELVNKSNDLAVGTSIAINGSDVYVAGSGGYWKNGMLTQFGLSAETFGICVVPK